MESSVVSELQNRPRILVLLISMVTLIVLLLNAYGMLHGITVMFPHLFYIPIVLASYFFPRRGILFAVLVSALYCCMALLLLPEDLTEILVIAGRVAIFILVAAIVTFLAIRIRRSEQLFRGVAERSSDMILLTDASGKARYVSPSVTKIFGYDPAEIEGKMPQEFIHPEDQYRVGEAVMRLMQGSLEENITLRMKKKGGEWQVLEFSGTPVIEKGSVSGIQVIGRDVTERIKSETALKESEEKYRLLADYTYDWEYWVTTNGALLYTTPSCERITGYSAIEFAKDKDLIRRIIHPEDAQAHEHHLNHGFGDKGPGTVDFRIICRNGDVRWIGHVCQPIYNAQGEFIGRRASNRDITARKRVEHELRDTNRRLGEIIGFLPDPTMVIDAAGTVVAWNHAMENLTGIPAMSIVGRGNYPYSEWFYGISRPVLIDLVLKEDYETIGNLYPRYRRFENIVLAEAQAKPPDGRIIDFWLTATPLYDEDGKISGAIESLRDVTHQKQITREWRESKNYLDAIINTISDPVFVKDKDHRFITLNDGFCRFVGYPREDLLGKTDHDFFPADDADTYCRMDDEVFRTKETNENEEGLTDAYGTRHTITTKKSLYVNSEGEEFIVGIIRDISERKQMETALKTANTKLNLLSSITRHDIRNQLLTLTAYLVLAKESPGDADKMISYLLKAEKAARAIEHQIIFTKEYEDLGVNAPTWQDPAACLATAAANLSVQNIRIVSDISGLEVFADPLFEKVFYNLIDNALRYGGPRMTEIVFRHRMSDKDLVLIVADNGIGISAEEKERLFERGFGHNTGLGLFLSREILSITGISITENGEPGSGARFEMVVPAGSWRWQDPRPDGE